MGITTGAPGSPIVRWATVEPANGNPAPFPFWPSPLSRLAPPGRPRPATPLRYQQTRFQTTIAEAGARLVDWARNPWRKLSLLLLTFATCFAFGVGVGTIFGAMNLMDLVVAVVCVLILEVSVRSRGGLRRIEGDRLPLHLLDMARMGLLYGLLLEGFKIL